MSVIRREATRLAAALAVCLAASAAAAADQITFVSQGGSYQEAQTKAILDPAAKALGITIKQDSSADAYPVVKTQVATGKIVWDVIDVAAGYCLRGAAEGLLEKLDLALIPNAKDLDPAFRSDHAVGYITYSTVLAWRTDKYGKNGPQTWADFWDVKKFPGRRSLRNYARPTLEIALMADGVPADKLYPLDVARAYRKLAEIKPHITTWWTSGGQSAQLIRDGEVDMIMAWNGRVGAVMKDGAKVDYHYNQAVLENTSLCVLKGTPNRVASMKFLNEAIAPRNQAALPLLIDYGPVNLKAYDTGIIPAARAAQLPTHPDNFRRQAVLSAAWWASPEGAKAEEGWLAFMQR
ncbi:MAG: ABC transporter substrate-binding protein [Alphaproteobacteria bacterium]|nr:ABC transporter substrate-binding protein [Alphaproteobacteria bacterium]